MSFIGNLIDKFVTKLTRRATDKITDKAVDKILGEEKQEKSVQAPETVENTNVSTENASVSQAEIDAQTQREIALTNAILAKQNVYVQNQAGTSMAQMNEIMSYFIFGKEMKIIGVKDDAPDWVKQAYEQGEFEDKE